MRTPSLGRFGCGRPRVGSNLINSYIIKHWENIENLWASV